MKAIKYFLIIALGSVSVQGLQASHSGLVLKSIQKPKTSFGPSKTPIQQKRELLTPHNLKGLYAAFKPEFAHLSPAVGAALLPNIKIISMRESGDSALTKLIHDSHIGLFHHADNALLETRNKSIPASSWGPRMIGTLVADLHLNKELDEHVADDIIKMCKASHKQAFGSNTYLSTGRIGDTLNALTESKRESTGTSDRAALYPAYYPFGVLTGLFWQKATTEKDIADYMSALENRMKFHGAESPFKDATRQLDDVGGGTYSDDELAKSLQEPLGRVMGDDQQFETRLAAEINKALNGAVLPQQVKQQYFGYEHGDEVSNCVEATLQDLCNLLLVGSNGSFDIGLLPSSLKPLATFKAFYAAHPSYVTVNDCAVGQAWMNLVSGHDGIAYRKSLRMNKKVYELDADIKSILRLLNILFGATAETYQELGEQLSSEHRRIEAEVNSEDNCVKFTVSSGTYNVAFLLCIDAEEHVCLEVPERDKRIDSLVDDKRWFADVTTGLVDVKNTVESTRAELLLPQRAHVIAANHNEPQSLAQATHIAYSNRKGVDPHRHWQDLIRDRDVKERNAILASVVVAEKDKEGRKVTGDILHWALNAKDYDLIEHLLKAGADVNVPRTQNGTVLLFEALRQHDRNETEQYELCALLIKYGALVNARDVEGRTPLFEAVASGNLHVCKLLVDHNADVTVQSRHGNTPLFDIAFASRASLASDLPLCTYLLKLGVDINAKGLFGETVLFQAVRAGKLELCRFLIESGADVHATNDGKTVFESAKQRAERLGFSQVYQEIVTLLEGYMH